MGAESGRHGYYATAALVAPMLLGIEALGGDAEGALAAAGLHRSALDDPERRLDARAAFAVFTDGVAQLGDDLGLRMAALYEPGTFAVLDYLAQSSATLGAALDRLIRYEALHQNCMRTCVRVDGTMAVIEQRYELEELRVPALAESNLATLVTIGRRLTGGRWRPTEVRFAHAAPADAAMRRRCFGCEVQWDAQVDAICLDAGQLQLDVMRADAALAETLEAHARAALGRMEQRGTLASPTREAIVRMLPDGAPGLERLAAELGTSSRTLQRRLAMEGQSPQRLLVEVRAELSLRYVGETSLSMDEVALMLGFSDARAFRRAFKRWHGESPQQSRKTARLRRS